MWSGDSLQCKILTVDKFFSSSRAYNCSSRVSHRDHSDITLLSREEQVSGGAGILLMTNWAQFKLLKPSRCWVKIITEIKIAKGIGDFGVCPSSPQDAYLFWEALILNWIKPKGILCTLPPPPTPIVLQPVNCSQTIVGNQLYRKPPLWSCCC